MAAPTKSVKIVAIGAGSSSFGRGIVVDAMRSEELNRLDCTLCLVDTNPKALDRMVSLAGRVGKRLGSKVKVEGTTDRRKALGGADFVITSVAIKRMPLWEQDFRVPASYGFHQALGENGGPGGVFHALRNFELMMPICKDIEALCPEALLLNYTNPESRIVMAINYLTKVKVAGLCHGVNMAREAASRVLERPVESVKIVTGGLNHFFWVLKVADAATGEDLYPELRRRIVEGRPVELQPLVRKLVEVFGYLTIPSDDHVGEYLQFAQEFTGSKWPYGLESRRIPKEEEREANWLDPYAYGEKPLDEGVLSPSGELAIPIILDVVLDRKRWEPAVNVLNDGSYVENLPRDAVVEVPAVVDAKGIHPERVGPIPEPLAAFNRLEVSIQKAVVEAYRTRSKKMLLQALLLCPQVTSVAKAEKLVDDMLNLQREYLPEFHD
ncbi:MAG: alpha-glucosidase/alpha-galactosidase [Candidatus Brockarchaeota archaeon]|nr:alpha-glucosidase/alpha-galactosidase [Candidatus Brockarchaeota archaeon]